MTGFCENGRFLRRNRVSLDGSGLYRVQNDQQDDIFDLPGVGGPESFNLDELFKLSDRIIVLYEGQIVNEFAIEEADIENVGLAMAGLNE